MGVTHVAVEGSATRSKRPGAYPEGVGGYAVSGRGAHLQTADGRTLIDWVGSLGATPLGYNHPAIVEAVTKQLQDGPIFSFPHVLEGTVAERLCEVIPIAESIKFVKTGSEACSAAVRIARAATGRDGIITLKGHYHGWHDWAVALEPDHPGVLDPGFGDSRTQWQSTPETVLDDLWGVSATPGRCAAIILEPATRWWVPDRQWLLDLVAVAHDNGALVIFDEMLLGGRVAMAGGSELFDVQPDLACYGKAFGAGHPLAFVAGSRDLMAHSEYVSGTYSGEALSLAACDAMLDVYPEENVIAKLTKCGLTLRAIFGEVGISWTGLPSLFAVNFGEDHAKKMDAFVRMCADRRVLFHPGYIAPCAALTLDDLNTSVETVYQTLHSLVASEEVSFGASVR